MIESEVREWRTVLLRQEPWRKCSRHFKSEDGLLHICDLQLEHEIRHYCAYHGVWESD